MLSTLSIVGLRSNFPRKALEMWKSFLPAMIVLLELCAMGHGQDVTKLYQPENLTSTSPEGESLKLPYRLLKPAHIESGKVYPLVLFLHGAGERGTDNEKQLKYLPTWLASDENRQKYPCFVIAPQCPDEMKWSNVPWDGRESEPLSNISRPMQAVVGILDNVIEHYPIDRSRIYLTGLSMGGYGSWELAERMPERFAALVPICGGGDETKADRLINLPTWAWHGDADQAVPVERSRRMIAAIEAAGGKPKYTELPGIGHDSWTPAYTGPAGLLPWLFEQAKTSPAAK
jgi:predicted peptidase